MPAAVPWSVSGVAHKSEEGTSILVYDVTFRLFVTCNTTYELSPYRIPEMSVYRLPTGRAGKERDCHLLSLVRTWMTDLLPCCARIMGVGAPDSPRGKRCNERVVNRGLSRGEFRKTRVPFIPLTLRVFRAGSSSRVNSELVPFSGDPHFIETTRALSLRTVGRGEVDNSNHTKPFLLTRTAGV